jgi:hypothetical protein
MPPHSRSCAVFAAPDPDEPLRHWHPGKGMDATAATSHRGHSTHASASHFQCSVAISIGKGPAPSHSPCKPTVLCRQYHVAPAYPLAMFGTGYTNLLRAGHGNIGLDYICEPQEASDPPIHPPTCPPFAEATTLVHSICQCTRSPSSQQAGHPATQHAIHPPFAVGLRSATSEAVLGGALTTT